MCLHACDRDLFYQDPVLFGSQDSVDTLIDAAAVVIQVPRSQLHVVGAHVYRRWKRVWIFGPTQPDPDACDPVTRLGDWVSWIERLFWTRCCFYRVTMEPSSILPCDFTGTKTNYKNWVCHTDLWPDPTRPKSLTCDLKTRFQHWCVYIDVHLLLARILDCYLH